MKNVCFLFGVVVAVLFSGQCRLMAFPATIDSDLLIDSAGSQSPWYSQLGEGWLHLQRVAGSNTRYKGTFTDNLGKGAVFPASADVSNASAPVLSVQSHFGKFVFQMDATFGFSNYTSAAATSFPPRLGSDASVYAAGYPHQAIAITYSLNLDIIIGPAGPKAYQSGMILTLIEDGIGYIAPRDSATNAVSSLLVPGAHPVSTRVTAPASFSIITNTTTDLNAIFLTVSLHGHFLTLLGHTSNGGVFYDGNIIGSGAGTAEVIGTFHMEKTSGPAPH